MKKIIKYSKKNDDLVRIKESLMFENKINLKNTLKINSLYNKQKKRDKCIICNYQLKSYDFKSHNVKYSFCKRCDHLNGKFLINKNFNEKIYSYNDGKEYSKKYSKLYLDRLNKIYLPKVKFMKSVIKKKLTVLDIGCGAGHFVKSCELYNIKAEGVDPNKTLVNFGKKYLKKNSILCLIFENTLEKIYNTKSDLISCIFVLEHLENPNEIFKAFKQSDAKYFYLAVPLFSFSSYIENVFNNIYPRQLGGTHTNLYSKNSLNFISKKYNLKIIGEWWFGSDLMDLYRSFYLSFNETSGVFEKKFREYFFKHINKLQSILDHSCSSSEVHLILKK